jgi:hypothetical protein
MRRSEGYSDRHVLGGGCSAGCCGRIARRVADRTSAVGGLQCAGLRPDGFEGVLPVVELPVEVENADGQRDRPQEGVERADDQRPDQTRAQPLEPEDTHDRVQPPQGPGECLALPCGLLKTPTEVVPQCPHGGLVVQRRILRGDIAGLHQLALDTKDRRDPPWPNQHETDDPAQSDKDVALERKRLTDPEEERRHDHHPERNGEPQRSHLLLAGQKPVDLARFGVGGPVEVVAPEFLLVEAEVDRLGQFPDRSHGTDREADRDDGHVGRDDDAEPGVKAFSEENARDSEQEFADSF